MAVNRLSRSDQLHLRKEPQSLMVLLRLARESLRQTFKGDLVNLQPVQTVIDSYDFS